MYRAMILMITLSVLALYACAPKTLSREEIPGLLPQDKAANEIFEKAENLFNEKDYDGALNVYKVYVDQFYSKKNTDIALMRIGEILMLKDDFEGAADHFQRVLAEFPESEFIETVHIKKLQALFGLSKYAQVVEEAMPLLKTDLSVSGKRTLLLLIADAQIFLESYADAAYRYNQVYQDFPEGEQDKIYAQLEKAVERLNLDEIELLLDSFTNERSKGLLLYRLAIVLTLDENYDAALEVLTRFLKNHPLHPLAQEAAELAETISQRYAFEPYTIGCILPLSGPYKIYGKRALRGIELALEKAGSGILSPRFKIVVKDSFSDPEMAVKAVRELADENVGAILGPMVTAEAGVAEAQSKKIPIIAFTQKDNITIDAEYVFRNFITPRMQVKSLVSYAVEELGLKRFAVLYPDEKYGKTYLNLFWDEVIAFGGEVVGVEAYDTRQTDFVDAIKKLSGRYYKLPSDLEKKGGAPAGEGYGGGFPDPLKYRIRDIAPDPVMRISGLFLLGDAFKEATEAKKGSRNEVPEPIIDFDAIFIPDAPKTAGLIIPQLAFHDIKDVYLIGTNLWHSQALIKMSRPYVQGALITDGFFADADSEVVKAFIKRFKTVYGGTPGIVEATAYDSAMILFEVMGRPEVRYRITIKDALLNLEPFDGTTGLTSFDATGDVNKELYMMRVKGRRFVALKRKQPALSWHR